MIPGVAVVHRREAWQDPAWPVVGPPVDARDIRTAVIHYTAAATIPGDLFAFHRSMQKAYAKPKTQGGRGYSLGYRWSVVSGGSRDGEVFQIRGWEFRSAANLMHNDYTEPILVLVNGSAPATTLAVRSVRAIIAESQRRSGRLFTIKGHGQLRVETKMGTATSCPGVGLQAQINAGVFVPPTPPPPPIDIGDDDMAPYLAIPPSERAGKPWLFVSSGVRPATSFDVDDGVPQRKMDSIPAKWRVEQYDGLHRAAGLG